MVTLFQPLLSFPAIIYFLILKCIRPCHPSAQKPGVVSYLSMNKSWSPYKGLSDLGPWCPVILFSFTSFQLHWLPRQRIFLPQKLSVFFARMHFPTYRHSSPLQSFSQMSPHLSDAFLALFFSITFIIISHTIYVLFIFCY